MLTNHSNHSAARVMELSVGMELVHLEHGLARVVAIKETAGHRSAVVQVGAHELWVPVQAWREHLRMPPTRADAEAWRERLRSTPAVAGEPAALRRERTLRYRDFDRQLAALAEAYASGDTRGLERLEARLLPILTRALGVTVEVLRAELRELSPGLGKVAVPHEASAATGERTASDLLARACRARSPHRHGDRRCAVGVDRPSLHASLITLSRPCNTVTAPFHLPPPKSSGIRGVGAGAPVALPNTMLRAFTMLAICAGSAVPAFADGGDRLDLGASLVRGSRMRPGEIEISGPLFAARYGLTDDTTVGAAAWPLFGFLGSGGGAQLALDRHGRLGDRWFWDVGGAALFFDLHPPGSFGAQLRGLGVHANIEWRTRRNALGLAVLAGGATARGFDDTTIVGTYIGTHMEGVAMLATYATSPWRWLAFELGAGQLAYVAMATDSLDGMTSPRFDSLGALERLVLDVHLHVRVSHWRVSLGAAAAPLLLVGIPSLTIARRW